MEANPTKFSYLKTKAKNDNHDTSLLKDIHLKREVKSGHKH